MSVFSKIKPIEVNDENPHKHDALGRERDCLFLVDLVEKSDTPFTLAVDAEWGNGKTVFIEMLQAHLKKKGFCCVFFNAWECDFYSEPLAPLIAEISREIPSDSSIGKIFLEKGPKLLECFKGAASLAHPLAPVIVKILETGFSNIKTENLSSIKDYEDYCKALKDFKESLKEFSSERQDDRPLIVLIDELDRCRPDFAINTLERVKHIFDVPSLFFVVSVNKKEFSNVVRSFYGCEDGERYLEKFFDLVFHLRNEKTLISSSLSEVDFDSFQERIKSLTDNQIPFDGRDYRKWFGKYLESVSRTFQFPLRVQQKLVSMLSIVLKTVDYKFMSRYVGTGLNAPDPYWENAFRCPLICYFLGLRIANPDLFHRSIESETSESFPWEENIKFYLYKSGMEKEINISGRIDASSLVETKLWESDFICLSLVALALSWGSPFVLSTKSEMLDDKIKKTIKVIEIYDYSSFHEFLKAIDFAGRFYEPEGTYKVKAPAKSIVESGDYRAN
ncbi:hypothetical protein F4X10_03690 [Candidatus Poribacteria bacterium]|nr:hypothetical protein [Candidatus Poribacteria bacterium]